ncbi:hypothetical protein D0U04_15600 [Bacillus clarus]|uniref:DUF5412 domain-containing protein n=1 Tax=Bacillus clarus TaxID=2338372 RepID=A0ABX9KUE1_9BACI|nr:hypothetical protein D0U04_15600 [Bacillus clarus]
MIRLLLIWLAILLIAIGLFFWKFFSLSGVSGGDLIQTVESPDGTYTINAYLANGGATTAFAIRGELIFNKRYVFTKKNIYWNYRENQANIEWKGRDTVIINGHTLHVPEDTFDFRWDKKFDSHRK